MNITNIETITKDLKILLKRVEFIDKVIEDECQNSAELNIKYYDEHDDYVSGEVILDYEVLLNSLISQKVILLNRIESLKVELIENM